MRKALDALNAVLMILLILFTIGTAGSIENGGSIGLIFIPLSLDLLFVVLMKYRGRKDE